MKDTGGSSIKIALVCPRGDVVHAATLVASIVRRTERQVWVRLICSRPVMRSFHVANLRVDFVADKDEMPVTEDRDPVSLRIAEFTEGWDKCLIMSLQHLVFCDLAGFFDQKPGEDGLASIRRAYSKSGVPAGRNHYVQGGILVDLVQLRDMARRMRAADDGGGDSIEKEEACMLEGPAIHRANELDYGESGRSIVEWDLSLRPWRRNAVGRAADFWAGEKLSWEALRMGQWEKPLIVEVQPGRIDRAMDLARRGWRVIVESSDPVGGRSLGRGGKESRDLLPDLTVFGDLSPLLAGEKPVARMVRFGSGPPEVGSAGLLTGAFDWLKKHRWRPKYVVLTGPVGEAEVFRFHQAGYGASKLLAWPAFQRGGPDPGVLDFCEVGAIEDRPPAFSAGEIDALHSPCVGYSSDLFLMRDEELSDDWWGGEGACQGCDNVRVFRASAEVPRGEDLYPVWRASMGEHGMNADLPSINVAFHGTPANFHLNATMLHSIVRRTEHPVHARCYCSGSLPEDFFVRNLLMEFVHLEAKSDHGGVNYGRSQLLADHPQGWERCWVMDHDHLATADLAEVYFNEFSGQLVMAVSAGFSLETLWDPGDGSGRESYFANGFIANLESIVEDGGLEKIGKYRISQGFDEHNAFVAAVAGRIGRLDERWNKLVYSGDVDLAYKELFPSVQRPESDYLENYGVLFFEGGPRPWWDHSMHTAPKSKERVWLKEYASWEKLRAGDWCRPEGCRTIDRF